MFILYNNHVFKDFLIANSKVMGLQYFVLFCKTLQRYSEIIPFGKVTSTNEDRYKENTLINSSLPPSHPYNRINKEKARAKLRIIGLNQHFKNK